MEDAPAPLRDAAFMDAFLDAVIPPDAARRLPGAGSVGITSGVAAGIASDGMLGPFVRQGLQAVHDAALERHAGGFTALGADARAEVIEAQLAAHPMLMGGVILHLYQAYYQHAQVVEALGVPPRPPFPEGYELEPTDPRLLEKLRERARPAQPG